MCVPKNRFQQSASANRSKSYETFLHRASSRTLVLVAVIEDSCGTRNFFRERFRTCVSLQWTLVRVPVFRLYLYTQLFVGTSIQTLWPELLTLWGSRFRFTVIFEVRQGFRNCVQPRHPHHGVAWPSPPRQKISLAYVRLPNMYMFHIRNHEACMICNASFI